MIPRPHQQGIVEALAEAIPRALPEAPSKPLQSPNQGLRPNKENTILATMATGRTLNRFQAEDLGDHTLPSTIATLRGKGHLFLDEWESVPTRFGKVVRVKRYTYLGTERAQA